MKKITSQTFLILLLVSTSNVYAIGINPEARASSTIPQAELKVLREQVRGEIGKIRNEFQTNVASRTASTSILIKEKRQALIQEIQTKRDLFKEEFVRNLELICQI